MCVQGKDLKSLFAHAALACFEIICEIKKVKPAKLFKFKIAAENLEELLVNFLRELIFQYSAKELLFSKFSVDKIEEKALVARAWGEKIDKKRHIFKNDLKAVTYHGLKVEKTKSGWQAEVIFDM